MNTQQMNMANMAGTGGPVGGAPMGPTGSHPGVNQSRSHHERLNTYIYDYFLRNELWDLAQAMHKTSTSDPNLLPMVINKKSSPGKDVNGVGDAMDTDNKYFKKPADLPEPGASISLNSNCFLADWWSQFWDMFEGSRNRGGGSISQYISANQNQARMRQEQQNRMLQNDPSRMMMLNRMQQQNGMPNELQKAALMNRNGMPPNPQQQQMLRNQMLQAQMNKTQREGGNMNMGEQRSQSPGSGDNNAPSPKRQRMEGNFNGQMGPAGRGQGMPGQPGNFQGPNGPQQMLLQNGLSQEQMMQQKAQIEAMSQGAQGSPMNQPNPDGGNHALQDYQMQLMLLEQQNKKRLLMARQEQDSMSHPPPGSGPMPGQQFAAPAMSPSGSRAGGPSPNPTDMAKRNTPKMGPGNLPVNPNSPADPNLQGNRGSPAPNFDPNQMAQMGNFYPMGMQQMQPPSSHPRGPGGMPINAQQMAELTQRGGPRMPNGQAFPPGGMMQNAQPGAPGPQPGQQPPMGTPRQATNMGPPPAPPAGEQGRTNPSSPSQQNAQPPTPSQGTKNIPNKGGKKDKQPPKKAANKGKNQGNTGATPASEAEPATPTPATPITPMHPKSFTGQNGAQPVPGAAAPGPQQPTPAASAQPPSAAAPPGLDPNAAPFGDLGGDSFGNLDLADFNSGDVLENFDFDSFLHTDGADGGFGFDGMNFDTTEVGGDV